MQIRVDVRGQELVISSPLVASGSIDTVLMRFIFSREWNGFHKTAIFVCEKKKSLSVLLDANNECVVPWEMLEEPTPISFGVFGIKDGQVISSTIRQITIEKGILSVKTEPADRVPSKDVFAQIINLLMVKQERLIPGDNIKIENNVISAVVSGSNSDSSRSFFVVISDEEPVVEDGNYPLWLKPIR